MKKLLKGCSAQSTVEYIIVVAIVILVAITFLRPNGGVMSDALNSTIETNVNSMLQMSNMIFN